MHSQVVHLIASYTAHMMRHFVNGATPPEGDHHNSWAGQCVDPIDGEF